MRGGTRLGALALAAALLLFATPRFLAAEDVVSPSAISLLEAAFDKMFNYPSIRSISLRIRRDGRDAGQRTFDIAYRKIDGRGHTILRFEEPSYLRGNALLMIQDDEGRNQTWLYRPGDGKARRVSTYQKADSFYGTDLSYEDLENRNWRDFDLTLLPDATEGGKAFNRVRAVSREYSRYSSVVIWIEKTLTAVAKIEFFQGDEAELVKTIRIDLEQVVEEAGLLKPGGMRVEIAGRDWVTEVDFTRIEINPEITRAMFATMRLHKKGQDLFKMVDQLAGDSSKE